MVGGNTFVRVDNNPHPLSPEDKHINSLQVCSISFEIFSLENFFFLRCHNAMKLGMVNKWTTEHFVLHTLQRNITQYKKNENLKVEEWKRVALKKLFG